MRDEDFLFCILEKGRSLSKQAIPFLSDAVHVGLLSAKWRFLDILLLSDSDVPLQRTLRAVPVSYRCSICVVVFTCTPCVLSRLDLVLWSEPCIFTSLPLKAGTPASCALPEFLCVCKCHGGGISPEPFAMQASFFIHPALTAQRHPGGGVGAPTTHSTAGSSECVHSHTCSCDSRDYYTA